MLLMMVIKREGTRGYYDIILQELVADIYCHQNGFGLSVKQCLLVLALCPASLAIYPALPAVPFFLELTNVIHTEQIYQEKYIAFQKC